MSCCDYTYIFPKVVGREGDKYLHWETKDFEADCNEFYILEDGTLMKDQNIVFDYRLMSAGNIEKADLVKFDYTGTADFYADEKFLVVIDFKDGKVEKVWRGLEAYRHLHEVNGYSYDDDDFDFDYESCPYSSIKV